jgi:hypothetical protein
VIIGCSNGILAVLGAVVEGVCSEAELRSTVTADTLGSGLPPKADNDRRGANGELCHNRKCGPKALRRTIEGDAGA